MSEYNIYEIAKCESAISALKTFPVICRVKAQHKRKVWELRHLVDEYCIPLNKFLYGEDNSEMADYRRAVLYDYKSTTKERLDNKLKLAVRNLIRSVADCIDIEYKTHDGRLMPHPSRRGEWIEVVE
jgi:hypothetical protein